MLILAASYAMLGAVEGGIIGAAGATCCLISSTLTFQRPEPVRRILLPAAITVSIGVFLHFSGMAWWGFAGLLMLSFVLGRVSDWMPTDVGVRWMMMPILAVWLVYSIAVGSWGGIALYCCSAALNAWRLLRPPPAQERQCDPEGESGTPSPTG